MSLLFFFQYLASARGKEDQWEQQDEDIEKGLQLIKLAHNKGQAKPRYAQAVEKDDDTDQGAAG